MTTVQIIGVAVAGAAVALLIIALIVTRRRGDEDDRVRTGSSFLDEAPQDTFAGLGKPEEPVEDVTLDPVVERAKEAERAREAERAVAEGPSPKAQPGGLGLDWGPDLTLREPAPETPAAPSWDAEPGTTGAQQSDDDEATGELKVGDDTESTGELQLAEALAEQDTSPAPSEESGGQAAAPEPARPAEGGPAAGDQAAPESGSSSRLVPLSDVIVTTSGKLVDLQDPETRRMLTELVTFEIDQAADFRRRGQAIDAVLQLTEAEKVSRALGMTETAQRIRVMMEEIREDA
jgi:hypothetical protein